MPLHLREPDADDVRAVLDAQRDAMLTYADVGQTLEPERRQRENVMRLDVPFEAAKRALAEWRQYDVAWTHVAEPRPPIAEGNVVAIVAYTFGLWSVNCSRIVRVIDEPGRFAYAIGTLPHHLETGEELFEVRELGDEGCEFRIASTSGANHPLVRIGWFAAEWKIRQFVKLGPSALARAAAGG